MDYAKQNVNVNPRSNSAVPQTHHYDKMSSLKNMETEGSHFSSMVDCQLMIYLAMFVPSLLHHPIASVNQPSFNTVLCLYILICP